MRLVPVTLIDEFEFNALVSETYGKPYNFQQQDFLDQNTIVRFAVPKNPDNYSDLPSLAEWVDMPVDSTMDFERECYPDLQDIVNDFHERGLLPAGEYALHIWW